MIALNKTSQKHNTEEKSLQEPHLCLSKPKTQMQTLTRMDTIAIEDYSHRTNMNGNVYWLKITYMLPIFFVKTSEPRYVHRSFL